jgi:hypothetical protein
MCISTHQKVGSPSNFDPETQPPVYTFWTEFCPSPTQFLSSDSSISCQIYYIGSDNKSSGDSYSH